MTEEERNKKLELYKKNLEDSSNKLISFQEKRRDPATNIINIGEDNLEEYKNLQLDYTANQILLAEFHKKYFPKPEPPEYFSKYREDYIDEFFENLKGPIVMAIEANGKTVKTQFKNVERVKDLWKSAGINAFLDVFPENVFNELLLEDIPEDERVNFLMKK